MGGIFYIIGVALAGYAGYSNLAWYFIFISSLIMAIAYSIIRAPQIHGVVSRDGIGALPKLLSIQVVLYLIITVEAWGRATISNCFCMENEVKT